MKIAALQPSYLPWLGYFDQMARVDRFVYLDDVQFTRRDWRNRNKIRTRDGWAWLTVPILQKNRFTQTLPETRIDPASSWRRKHLETLRLNYAHAPYFDLYFPSWRSIYNKEWRFLLDLCLETLETLRAHLGIETPVVRASGLGLSGTKGSRILALCERLDARHYLSGDAAGDYLPAEEFRRRGIGLEFQNYRHPVYPQRFPGFVSHLSVIDLLFNAGPDSLSRLRSGATGRPAAHR